MAEADPLKRKSWSAGAGYLVVWCPKKKRAVYQHRAVWEFFYDKIPDGMEINHKNGKKTDNRIVNLELVTRSQNQRHAIKTGLNKNPPMRSHRVLTDNDISNIRLSYVPRVVTHAMLAKKYDVSSETIARCCRRQSWPNH